MRLSRLLRPFVAPCSRHRSPLDWAIKLAIVAAVALASPLAAWARHGHLTFWGH